MKMKTDIFFFFLMNLINCHICHDILLNWNSLILVTLLDMFFIISFQVDVKKMNADGTVEQEKKFYYENYLPKYEWVYMHRTSRIEYTW